MKTKIFELFVLLLILTLTENANAQLTIPPDGGNKKAAISEQIGITMVTVDYNRPHVKGLEGHIWGELIPVGFFDPGSGTAKSAPWRAGANENTTISFSTDVKIAGQYLPAGKYGLFVAYDPDECTIIFSKNSTSWGNFYYNPAEDILKVKVKPVKNNTSVEWLKYEFADETDSSAELQLEWEKLIIPFKINVDLVSTQLASFRMELRGEKGFDWENLAQAALYCVKHKANLDEALLWANAATSENSSGFHEFKAWTIKAMVIDSLGRTQEADEAMKTGTPFGDVVEFYHYARLLAKKKQFDNALKIYLLNAVKNPDDFIANLGLARGYSGIGNLKKAMYYAKRAQSQAEDDTNKRLTAKIIDDLTQHKDIS